MCAVCVTRFLVVFYGVGEHRGLPTAYCRQRQMYIRDSYNSFTKLREVEALYNYLVKTVDSVNKAKGNLGARDIAVYVPQLDPYIPAIKTVFDTAPHKFPYTLVSKGFSREEGFWSALEQVLDFEEEHFTAPAVFNLLECAPIQKSFGFSSELDLLRKAFLEANIRREYKGKED